MIRRLLSAIGFSPSSKRPNVSDAFDVAAANYVNLVKSRVIGALFIKDEQLCPEPLAAEFKHGMLVALCAYFVARTDLELKERGLDEDVREYVWISIPEFVFEEMGFVGADLEATIVVVRRQAGLMGGVIENHGRSNVPALAKSIGLLADSNEHGRAERLQHNLKWLIPGLERLLMRCEAYFPRLDKLSSVIDAPRRS